MWAYRLAQVAVALVLLGAIAFGFWLQLAGPCWVFSLSPAGEVPLRCLPGADR